MTNIDASVVSFVFFLFVFSSSYACVELSYIGIL